MPAQSPEPDPDQLFEKQKKLAEKLVERKLKRVEKRVQERIQTLTDCKNWGKVHHDGLLLQSNLFRMTKGMKEIAVADWELDGAERTIVLNPLVAPQSQIASFFRRGKKLRLGLPHAERMLQKAENELAECIKQKQVLEQAADMESLNAFFQVFGPQSLPQARKRAPVEKKPAKPYHTFISEAGVEIWVGKSAKDNDKLTFHCANGLDWWLHAHNYPGSHVVVRCEKGQELDPGTLSDAAELALRYSKAKNSGEGEVCLTHVKALSRVKGVPGKVMLSKPKVLRVVLDEKRWQRLHSSTSLKR